MAEGYTGGGPGGDTTAGFAGGRLSGVRNGRSRKPILEKTKSVKYNATTSDQLLSISGSESSTSTGEPIPKAVEVENKGRVPIMVMSGYREWTSATADAGSAEGRFEYLHTMIMPGETFSPPIRSVIRTGETDGTESKVQMLGTAIDNKWLTDDGLESGTKILKSSVSAYIDGAGLASGTTATTFNVDDNGGSPAAAVGFFRVGDLIRIENEILEVTAIAANTGTEAQLTVKRGVHGSTAATHADNTQIELPFFNAYHDFDKFSVAQTDAGGKFKSNNFFATGRANSGVQGIVPGSVAIKFYEPGYQELGLTGITGSTNSGLTAGETLKLDITVDGGTKFQDLTFTLDSSNVNFGGTNGVIAKIQAALDAQFYTAGNLFEKKVHVGIVNGDIRFTSGSHLSTSAILLEDTGDSDTFIDAAANGRIPASGNLDAPVAAKLPDDVSYDKITYEQIPNSAFFCYDDGKGNLMGRANGIINYETGAIEFRNAPVNAEFVYSAVHTSAFSGKLTESTDERINSLTDIYVNTPSQKWNGSVALRTY
tara:strand:+ start:2521 stop:4140 length:1620 start_codon:yes stop_codon:yes gene_type:complete